MKTNLGNWLSALCAILLIVLIFLQTKEKNQLDTLRQEHEDFVKATTQSQQEARATAVEMANVIQQQTAVLHRAIGKIIPVELPASLANKLAALEARIGDEKSWPKDSPKADAMIAELRDLTRQIPPWAEEDYLSRLNSVRWGVQSLGVIQANANAQGEDLSDAAETYANQLSIQPDGGSTNIAAVLTSRQQDATARFTAFRRESAINGAKEQLGLAVMTDGLGAWQHLAEWTNDPTVGSNALKLRQQLHSRLLDDGIANFVGLSQDNLQKLGVITNSSVRQAGYARLFDSATEQRLNLLEQPDVSQDSRNKLENFSKTVENKLKDEGNKQNLGYQQWALGKIRDFRKAFDSAMNRTKAGELYGVNPSPDLQGVDAAMIHYLTPISPGYLDASVANLFNQAFNDGWSKLDGSLQVDVAEQDVKILKRTPQNYTEGQ